MYGFKFFFRTKINFPLNTISHDLSEVPPVSLCYPREHFPWLLPTLWAPPLLALGVAADPGPLLGSTGIHVPLGHEWELPRRDPWLRVSPASGPCLPTGGRSLVLRAPQVLWASPSSCSSGDRVHVLGPALPPPSPVLLGHSLGPLPK